MSAAALELDPTDWSEEELTDAAPRCTDSANADAFIGRHGEGFRYVIEWGKWLAWNGQRWCPVGAAGRVAHAAMLSAREEYAITKLRIQELEEQLRVALLKSKDQAEILEDRLKVQRFLLKWHEQSQNASRINACVSLLSTRLTLTVEELDADPWALNLLNGTLDLRTGELRPHTRFDHLTQQTDLEWDDAATCPTWDAFLYRVMGGDRRLVLYLQRVVGYALTALTREHVLFFLYGEGRNGKSTFLHTIQKLAGRYGCAAPRDLLFAPRGGSAPHPSELARLHGKRIAVCAEVGDGHEFDEAKVKDLTGGDRVACRRMNEDWWDYEPTHTLFLAGNHKPRVSGTDLGIWRRMRLIPWLVTIDEAEVDANLPDKLLQELPGILRWAVNGALEWQRLGLEEPEPIRQATQEYRAEADILGAFLTELCVVERGARASATTLRERYERWCKESGHQPVGGRRFDARLRTLGCERGTVRDGQVTRWGWRGVRLKTDQELWESAEPTSAEN